MGVWGSVLGCGRVYGVSVEGVRKSVEKCVGVWRDVRKGMRVCGGVGRGKERCQEVCWGVGRGKRRGVGGAVGRGVEDAVECGGCGKVC